MKRLLLVTVAGILVSMLVVIPVFAGYGDTGGSGGGFGGAGDSNGVGCCASPSPFEPVEFFAEVAMFGLAVWMFLNPKLTGTVSGSIYQALRLGVLHLTLRDGDKI
jgi:hypothetical protein